MVCECVYGGNGPCNSMSLCLQCVDKVVARGGITTGDITEYGIFA